MKRNSEYGRLRAAAFFSGAGIASAFLFFTTACYAEAKEWDQACVMKLVDTAADSMTLSEIREQCNRGLAGSQRGSEGRAGAEPG